MKNKYRIFFRGIFIALYGAIVLIWILWFLVLRTEWGVLVPFESYRYYLFDPPFLVAIFLYLTWFGVEKKLVPSTKTRLTLLKMSGWILLGEILFWLCFRMKWNWLQIRFHEPTDLEVIIIQVLMLPVVAGLWSLPLYIYLCLVTNVEEMTRKLELEKFEAEKVEKKSKTLRR